MERRAHKLARSAMREQGRSKNRYRFAAPRQIVANECSWEHSDAIVSFAGAGQRRRLFRGLDISTIKWGTGGLPEECRFLFNTQLIFLKKEKDPTTKEGDDDEWIRSLTDAQEATSDIPEDSVSHDQQDVDPKKVRPIQMGESLRKYVSRRLLALSEGETAALTSPMLQIGVATPAGAGALAIFHQLITMNG